MLRIKPLTRSIWPVTELEQPTDWELISRARVGDELSFEELMHRYTPRVFQIISRFFRRRERVEELAQEVFLKAYTQLAAFEGRGSFEGWLLRIATHLSLNELRRAKRHPESPVADLTDAEARWLDHQLADISAQRHESAESNMIAADLSERVLKTLPPDDRLVLTLLDGNELSVKEVSELTGWSQAKVKVKGFRARRRMRKAVEALLKGRIRTGRQDSTS